MSTPYWYKQTANTPLYPDILWSRPESKMGAGKLAIIGGNVHAISAPGIAYNIAMEAGVGTCKVMLPDAVKKTVKLMLPDAEFAPSTPSGSFSKRALDELLNLSGWSDGTLLAGSFGRNSETATLLESFVAKFPGLLTITEDALDYFKSTPRILLERSHTCIIASLAQLQRIYINIPLITPIVYSMTLLQLVEALHELTLKHPATVLVKHNDLLCIAHGGTVVTTDYMAVPWRVQTASRASVFWLQNPGRPLESISSSILY